MKLNQWHYKFAKLIKGKCSDNITTGDILQVHRKKLVKKICWMQHFQ